MPAQKRLTDAPKKRLDDDVANALLLQCLFVSVGEGTSAPQIARFIGLQSARSFSAFRLEEMLTNLIKIKHVKEETITTKGGRIYRKYSTTICGVISLASMSHLLPAEIKKDNTMRFMEITNIAREKLEEQKFVNSGEIITTMPEKGAKND